ncbi:MAG: hypothetical protein ACJ72E_03810 [Marmoricola sp.]
MTDPEKDRAENAGATHENVEEDFDDASYADISAQLAGARETGPAPAEVVARLDATLADLTAGRTAGRAVDLGLGSTVQGEAEVVALAPRRRRAPRLLAAAAAVVVLGGAGVGLTQVLGNKSNDSLAHRAAGDSAGTALAATPGTDFVPSQPRSSVGADELKGLDNLALGYAARLPAFTTAGFATQAAQYVTAIAPQNGSLDDRADAGGQAASAPAAPPAPTASGNPTPAPGALSGQAPPPGSTLERTTRSQAASKAACTPPADSSSTGSTTTPITFDRRPATLVVHPAVSGNQLVQAWSCDGSTVLATAVLAR